MALTRRTVIWRARRLVVRFVVLIRMVRLTIVFFVFIFGHVASSSVVRL